VLGCEPAVPRDLVWPPVKQKPIKRSEVRLNSRGAIVTLPQRGCRARRRESSFGTYLVHSPIKSLWLPLVRRLKVEMPEPHWFMRGKCRVCERPFLLASIAGNYSRNICSDKCVATWNKTKRCKWRRDQAAKRREDMSHRTCAYCGGALNAERKSKRYCSVLCRVAAYRAT